MFAHSRVTGNETVKYDQETTTYPTRIRKSKRLRQHANTQQNSNSIEQLYVSMLSTNFKFPTRCTHRLTKCTLPSRSHPRSLPHTAPPHRHFTPCANLRRLPHHRRRPLAPLSELRRQRRPRPRRRRPLQKRQGGRLMQEGCVLFRGILRCWSRNCAVFWYR